MERNERDRNIKSFSSQKNIQDYDKYGCRPTVHAYSTTQFISVIATHRQAAVRYRREQNSFMQLSFG